MATLRTASLYIGAGGLDLGLEAAGFEVGAAVEMDPEAVASVRANRDWNVLCEPIQDVTSQTLMNEAGLGEGEADLLCGGPPCQPFSKSGYWHSGDAKRLNDPRADTLRHYLRVLRDLAPRAFLLENVPGLAFSHKDEGLVFLAESIEAINREIGTRYAISAAQLNACEHGVPQTRQRVFVIGHREGRRFEFPQPTHRLPARVDLSGGKAAGGKAKRRKTKRATTGNEPAKNQPDPRDLEPAMTAWDAIGHLDSEGDRDPGLNVRGKWAKLLPSIPEGMNYLWFTDRGGGYKVLGNRALFGWRRRYWSMLLKLSKHRPSWTLTARPGPAIGPFHWRSRRLSAAELCALQTFPPGYRIIGSPMSAHRQVGNAVPSALTELLGREIRRQLFDQEPPSGALTLLPQRAGHTPDPEPVAPVAPPYLELAGEHADHPGTGLGPGAKARAGST